MEEKRKDLRATKQREVITRIVSDLSTSHPSFYYLPTTDVAHEIVSYIADRKNLNQADYELVKELSPRDIQIILSYHADD